jgi:RNA polymerase sigma factor (sigma-70 family)
MRSKCRREGIYVIKLFCRPIAPCATVSRGTTRPLFDWQPMSDTLPFADFVERIRDGDNSAAEELVRLYGPLIRREVRLRFKDDRLKRAFDSIDVCQSVLASFFVRAASGEYELASQGQLVGLLVTMARNKLASRARQEHRLRRDTRRNLNSTVEALEELPDPQPSAIDILSRRELLENLRLSLTDEERRIADLRGDGLGWDEVAVRLGGTGQARRMQFTRGVERVGRQLGFAD